MSEFWETAFSQNQLDWGLEPTQSALFAAEYFAGQGIRSVLIPGLGYGRNAIPFLDRGMAVTGIEISATAIAMARSRLNLQFPIHHGSVTAMPFDAQTYQGIFCYGLIHLLGPQERAHFIQACYQQLSPGGLMMISAVTQAAPMYRLGTKLGPDWYEVKPGLKMYFYDDDAVQREFGPWGLQEYSTIIEAAHSAAALPFFNVICKHP